MIGILELRTENNHYAVLQKVVELYRIRVESLTLQIMDPRARWELLMMQQNAKGLLFLGVIDLEADDISILNLALSKCHFRLHKLDHSRFNFLWSALGRTTCKTQGDFAPHIALKEFQGSISCAR